MDKNCYDYCYCPPCMCGCCQPTYQPARRFERLTKKRSFPKLEPLLVKPLKVLHKKAINNENNANKLNTNTKAAQSSGRKHKLTEYENHISSVPRNSAALLRKSIEKKFEKFYATLEQPTNSKAYTTKEGRLHQQRYATQESSSTDLIWTKSQKYLLEMRDNYRKRSQIPIPKRLSAIRRASALESNKNSEIFIENSFKTFQVEEAVRDYKKYQPKNISEHSEISTDLGRATESYESLKELAKISQAKVSQNQLKSIKTPPSIAPKPRTNNEKMFEENRVDIRKDRDYRNFIETPEPTDCIEDCSSLLLFFENEIGQSKTDLQQISCNKISKQNENLKELQENLNEEHNSTESNTKLYAHNLLSDLQAPKSIYSIKSKQSGSYNLERKSNMLETGISLQSENYTQHSLKGEEISTENETTETVTEELRKKTAYETQEEVIMPESYINGKNWEEDTKSPYKMFLPNENSTEINKSYTIIRVESDFSQHSAALYDKPAQAAEELLTERNRKDEAKMNKSYTIIRVKSDLPLPTKNSEQETPEASYDKHEAIAQDASLVAQSAEEEAVIEYKKPLNERQREHEQRKSLEHISKKRFLQSSYDLALDHRRTPPTTSSTYTSLLSAEKSLSKEKVMNIKYNNLHYSTSAILSHMERATIPKARKQETLEQTSSSSISSKELVPPKVVQKTSKTKLTKKENKTVYKESGNSKDFLSKKSTQQGNAIQSVPHCSCKSQNLKIAIEIQKNQLNMRCDKNCAFNIVSKQFKYPSSICERTAIPKTAQELWAKGEYYRSTPQTIDKQFKYTYSSRSDPPRQTNALRRRPEVSETTQEMMMEEKSFVVRNNKANLTQSSDWILVEADQQYEHTGSKETIITIDIISLKQNESEREIGDATSEYIDHSDLLKQEASEQFEDQRSTEICLEQKEQYYKRNNGNEEIAELTRKSTHSLERISSCKKQKFKNDSSRSLLPHKTISTNNLRQRLTKLQEELDALGVQRSTVNETTTQITNGKEIAKI